MRRVNSGISGRTVEKQKTFVITADSRGMCISGSSPTNSRSGSLFAKPAGQTIEAKLVIATEEPAKPTAATANSGYWMQAQISSH